MSELHRLSRRVFLRQFGTTSFAIAVFGFAACSEGESVPTPARATTMASAATSPTTSTSSAPSTTSTLTGTGPTYRRVNLGFVSAYILIRSGAATIVDTGVSGSAPDIETALRGAALDWSDVENVIFTHRHEDHIGSGAEVLARADRAVAHAGEADVPHINTPRPVQPVGDGDEVSGLQIIHTPGHTPGHICVLDPRQGVLVAGDALIGADGGVAGPNPSFTPDMELAHESVKKLADLSFETILFGHGEPIERGADSQVSALAESL